MNLLLVGHCAFGIDTDIQNEIDNMYMKKSSAVFARDFEKILIVRLSNLMPILDPLLVKMMDSFVILINFLRVSFPSLLGHLEDPPQLWIFKQIENVIQHRLASENKRIDLLQLMLDVSTQEKIKVSYLINSITFHNDGYHLFFRIMKMKN